MLVPVASPEPKRNFIKTKTGNTFQKQYYNTFISGRCLYSIELICDPFMQMDYINYLLKLQIFSVAFNLSLENSRIGNSFQHFSTTRNCLLLLHPFLHGSCQKTDFIIASVGLTLVFFMIRIACGFVY